MYNNLQRYIKDSKPKYNNKAEDLKIQKLREEFLSLYLNIFLDLNSKV